MTDKQTRESEKRIAEAGKIVDEFKAAVRDLEITTKRLGFARAR